MIPGNYSVHFSEFVEALPAAAREARPMSVANMEWIAEIMRGSQHFVLPDGGSLIDLEEIPDYAPMLLRPPYPVTVIEYAVSAEQEPGTSRSSKRIVVAISSDAGILPPHPMVLDGDPPDGPGVWLYSIIWNDQTRLWLAFPIFVFISYDIPVCKGATILPEVLRVIRMTPEKASRTNSLKLRACGFHPELFFEIDPNRIGGFMADFQSEMSSYIEMCMALGCANVSTDNIISDTKLNRSRSRSGKPPLHDYHVLTIPGSQVSGAASGSGNSKRSHLRRGHIRRLRGARMTWVNATMVKGGTRGFVSKSYAVDNGREVR